MATTLVAPLTIPIKDAAARLAVHENTIRSWVDRGLLDSYRTPTGRRKIRLDDVERLEREMYGVPHAVRDLGTADSAPAQLDAPERAEGRLP